MSENKLFVEYNHNPLGKKVGNCVVRAIGKALNVSWERVFEDLVNIARENKSVPSWKETYMEYLKIYPKLNAKYDTPKGKKRYTVAKVCELPGSYVIQLAHHLTCVVDGKCYDLWDCTHKSAYRIWRVNQ